MHRISQGAAKLVSLLAVAGCGRGDALQLDDLLPTTRTHATAARAGSQGSPDVEDAGPEYDSGETDAEGPCRRGFAGAVGVMTDDAPLAACAVLVPARPLECIARRTECVSALSCPDVIWHESLWAFDHAGQTQATLKLGTDQDVPCTGELAAEGYDMHWTCNIDGILCQGMIRSFFE